MEVIQGYSYIYDVRLPISVLGEGDKTFIINCLYEVGIYELNIVWTVTIFETAHTYRAPSKLRIWIILRLLGLISEKTFKIGTNSISLPKIISEDIFLGFKSPKKQTKFLKDFCPSL